MVSIRKRNSKTSYGLFWFLNFPHATRNFHAHTHFQLAHAQTNFPAVFLQLTQLGNLLPLCKNSAGNRIKIKFSKYYHIFSKMPGI